MMEMTNGARLGIAMMGLGCARRALVEAMCYARRAQAFGKPLADQPLMQRKLAELIVDVEAAQALVFDGYDPDHRLRIGAPLIKLRAARLGITAASDAIEVHGGNGYVENWPVARILRDAQVNTLWEGPDNILCLDVRRGIEREQADVAFLDRSRRRGRRTPPQATPRRRSSPSASNSCRRRSNAGRHSIGRPPRRACSLWPSSWSTSTPARCSSSRPDSSRRELGTDRKALVARLYADRHLADHGPLRGIDEPAQGGARAVQGALGRRAGRSSPLVQ